MSKIPKQPRDRGFDPKKSARHAALPTMETPSPENLFGTHLKTQESIRAVSWDSTYYMLLNYSSSLRLERAEYYGGADDSTRDGAMTVVAGGTYPTVKIDYAFYRAQRMESSLLQKDEWVDVQELASIEKGLGDLWLCAVLADQVFMHKWLPSSPEDDALGAGELKWTENSVNEAINRLVRNGYTIHPIALNFLRTVNVYFRYDSPYMRRGMPGGYMKPWMTKPITYANWVTSFKYLKGLGPTAGLHYKRIGIEPIRFDPSILDAELLDMNTERGFVHLLCTGLCGKDGGGNAVHAAYATTVAGAFGWANVDLYAPVSGEGETANRPNNIWALLSFWCGFYDATNQFNIKYPVGPASNSYWKIAPINFNSNTAPAVEFVGTDSYRIADCFPMLAGSSATLSYANGGAALTDAESQDQFIGRKLGNTHTKIDAPYSESIWDEIFIDVLRYMRKQPLK